MKYLLALLLVLAFIVTSCTAPQDLSKEFDDANKKLLEQQQEIGALKEQIKNLQTGQSSEEIIQPQFKVDLTQWNDDEIVQALATKNSKFKNATWFQYRYGEDGVYYDLIGPIFPRDPFYDIVYSTRNRELKVNGLRLFNLDPGNKEVGDAEYQKYEDNIKKKLLINQKLNCTFNQECRGTTLAICNAEGSTLYSWFSYPYLFIARDDNGETYQAFKEFYC